MSTDRGLLTAAGFWRIPLCGFDELRLQGSAGFPGMLAFPGLLHLVSQIGPSLGHVKQRKSSTRIGRYPGRIKAVSGVKSITRRDLIARQSRPVPRHLRPVPVSFDVARTPYSPGCSEFLGLFNNFFAERRFWQEPWLTVRVRGHGKEGEAPEVRGFLRRHTGFGERRSPRIQFQRRPGLDLGFPSSVRFIFLARCLRHAR